MENKKLTAVEWLRENLHLAKDPFTQALELEKEQIINDYCNGRNSVIEKSIISAEQYYNETYVNN